MCEPTEKSKQTFVISIAKLALDQDLILKTLDRHVRLVLKIDTYIQKNILLAGRKGELENKRD